MAGAGQDTDMAGFEVVHNPDAGRYELLHDGQVIGDIEYKRRGEAVVMMHTRVAEEFGGRGLAARLAAFALADVRAAGRQVVPVCPYVRRYIGSHPQWQDLVATDRAGTE